MSSQSVIRLESDHLTVLLKQTKGVPEVIYAGRCLPAELDREQLLALTAGSWPHGLLDHAVPLTLLPETGQGFAGMPGIRVQRSGRELNLQLQYKHKKKTAHGIQIELEDPIADLAIILDINLDPSSNIISSCNRITNNGADNLEVLWLASVVWKVAEHCRQVNSTGGRWGREFQPHRQVLAHGALVFENRIGRSSHASYPAITMGSADLSAQRGDAVSVALGWGGNHRLLAEKTPTGGLQLQAGELLAAGEMVLAAGDSYRTPTAYLGHSNEGENSLRHDYHGFFRDQRTAAISALSAKDGGVRNAPVSPVHFNTWEACYFQQDEHRMLALVREAAALGAERFILDDGWMKDRTSDQRGLGNWTPCVGRYPNGLEPIVEAVHAQNMQFGLWIEPEMVNKDSDVFREHPDWILKDGDRLQPIGRNQYVLNLCREDVFDFLLTTICGLIVRYQLDYLKWDMNRDLVHAVADERPANHRMTEAFYRLVNACREFAPAIEIEICASGGARADFGSALVADRIWTSDTHDPHERQKIHRSFSVFLPVEIMGSHIGSETSAISGRRHSMAFRGAIAMQGHLGLELDPAKLDDGERRELAKILSLYKQHRPWLHTSTTWYVDCPDPNMVVRLQVSQDKGHALLYVAQLESPVDAIPAGLVLPGLAMKRHYAVTLTNSEQFTFMKNGSEFHEGKTMTVVGALLMTIGLQLPIQQPDTCAVIEIIEVALSL
jgi:alpha-galactosidase